MKVSKYMTRPVVKVDASTNALTAAKIMAERNVDSLIITTENQDVGIITFDDIVAIKQRRLEQTYVKDHLINKYATIESTTECEEALRKMIDRGVRRLLVTEKDDIIGIFTLSNIICYRPLLTE
jgi:predicted transcriptional regulator